MQCCDHEATAKQCCKLCCTTSVRTCSTSGDRFMVTIVVPCRSPQYNSVRLGFTMIIALCFGAFYWGVSRHRHVDSSTFFISAVLQHPL